MEGNAIRNLVVYSSLGLVLASMLMMDPEALGASARAALDPNGYASGELEASDFQDPRVKRYIGQPTNDGFFRDVRFGPSRKSVIGQVWRQLVCGDWDPDVAAERQRERERELRNRLLRRVAGAQQAEASREG